MARTLRERLNTLDPARRARIEAEADRLHAEYLTLRELRKAKDLTQVQLAEALGIRQATVAKYERQSDLLLSTLGNYVRALGGSLELVVRFPGHEPVTLAGLGETSGETRPLGSPIAAGDRDDGTARSGSSVGVTPGPAGGTRRVV